MRGWSLRRVSRRLHAGRAGGACAVDQWAWPLIKNWRVKDDRVKPGGIEEGIVLHVFRIVLDP